ncbi:MAG: NAD-dependent epimerase/dehydratase family protein [Burkholderiales bacterium]|nr:NAD-dependent epimerase/dehydratase family protein [Burkholderiales bacterium]
MSAPLPSVLVTGAGGFVGLRLCARLAAAGHTVRAAVRRESAGLAAIAPAVDVVPVGDIGPDTDWRAALDGMDLVVHLAARAHVMRDSAADPLAAYRRINVAGSVRLARAAAAAGASRLIYMSSIKVNGEATAGTPFCESDAPAPLDAYGRSKWEAEQALRSVAAQTGLAVSALRPPMIYGPGVKGNLARLLQWIARGLPLPFASIANRRSLIYLENLIDATLALMRHPAPGKIYLVSDAHDLSTPQLVRALARGLDRPARLLPFPPSLLRLAGSCAGQRDAVARLVGSLQIDASRIAAELGWRPAHDPEQGLVLTARAHAERAGRAVELRQ